MKRFWQLISRFWIGLPLFFFWTQPAQAQIPAPEPVVRAVLYYSPACSHCHYVITEVLPPLLQQYGDQLLILGVDITQPGGQDLFVAALNKFGMESGGVPFLVIADTYLVGSVDIPSQFPGLIEQYLAQGGVDWPDIPGLAEVIPPPQTMENPASSPIEPTPTLQPINLEEASSMEEIPIDDSTVSTIGGAQINSTEASTLETELWSDQLGNVLAVVVLFGMVLSALVAALFFHKIPEWPIFQAWGTIIPILSLIGLGVAGYLAHVETTQVQAVCGPVGDCNTVQQSAYAHLFGVLPIGVLGLIGYVTILFAWVVARFASPRRTVYASLALLGITAFGLLVSIYLTFLEPFVIGATCAWCLTSAVLMTALFWLSLSPGKQAINYFRLK